MAQAQKKFIEYYELFKDKIFNYFYYRVGFNRDLAEDLCSDVFLKALDNFDAYDPSRPFQPWIFRIAHNRLANHYRSIGREASLDEALGMEYDTAQAVETAVESAKLIELIACQDDYCREILFMRFVDGLEISEIAAVLDKEEGAVRTQLCRALNKIRHEIAKKYGQIGTTTK